MNTKTLLLAFALLISTNLCCMEPQDTTILKATITGNITKVRELLEQNSALINVRDERNNTRNWTPLHWSVSKDHIEITRLLLQYGANVNALDEKNCTPLHYATDNSKEIVHMLLQQPGIVVDPHKPSNLTPLNLAVLSNRSDIVRLLLIYGAQTNRIALDWTAMYLRTRAIQLIMDWPLYNQYIDRHRKNIITFAMTRHSRLGKDSLWKNLDPYMHHHIAQFIVPNYPLFLKPEHAHSIEQIHQMAKQERKESLHQQNVNSQSICSKILGCTIQ